MILICSQNFFLFENVALKIILAFGPPLIFVPHGTLCEIEEPGLYHFF